MITAKVLSILNLLAFIATIIVNGLAISLPLNGKTTGELSDLYPNLFVPAGQTFAIWGIIYLLVSAFCIYQLILAFQSQSDPSLITKIGPWFIISSLANCSWIFAWHYIQPFLSLIIMIILLFSLIKIYLILHHKEMIRINYRRVLVHPSFSIYLGWITVATIANTTAFLVHINWQGWGIDPQIWTIIMILVASGIGFYFGLLKRDIYYALVIIWALYGIYQKRSISSMVGDHEIIITVIIGIILVGGSIVLTTLKKIKRLIQ